MISPKTAAARLGLSVGRVRQLISTGALRAVNVGLDRPVWAIEEAELARFTALDRPSHRPRKEPEMNPMTHYRQTIGGDYDSRPKAGDVLAQMEGDDTWQREYADRGHGEYINNVCELADALSNNQARFDVNVMHLVSTLTAAE